MEEGVVGTEDMRVRMTGTVRNEEIAFGLGAETTQPRSLEQVVGISAKPKFVSPEDSIVL